MLSIDENKIKKVKGLKKEVWSAQILSVQLRTDKVPPTLVLAPEDLCYLRLVLVNTHFKLPCKDLLCCHYISMHSPKVRLMISSDTP